MACTNTLMSRQRLDSWTEFFGHHELKRTSELTKRQTARKGVKGQAEAHIEKSNLKSFSYSSEQTLS